MGLQASDDGFKDKPQAIALFSYPENGVTIIRQALELGFTGKFLLADGMKAPEVVQNVGAEYLKGTYGTTPGAREGSAKARFVEAYTQRFGAKPPKPYIDNCYDAIAVLALAIHQAKSSEPKAIRDALRQVANPPGESIEPGDFQKAFALISQGKKVNYRGASGEVDFEEHGDVGRLVRSFFWNEALWTFEQDALQNQAYQHHPQVARPCVKG